MVKSKNTSLAQEFLPLPASYLPYIFPKEEPLLKRMLELPEDF